MAVVQRCDSAQLLSNTWLSPLQASGIAGAHRHNWCSKLPSGAATHDIEDACRCQAPPTHLSRAGAAVQGPPGQHWGPCLHRGAAGIHGAPQARPVGSGPEHKHPGAAANALEAMVDRWTSPQVSCFYWVDGPALGSVLSESPCIA